MAELAFEDEYSWETYMREKDVATLPSYKNTNEKRMNDVTSNNVF